MSATLAVALLPSPALAQEAPRAPAEVEEAEEENEEIVVQTTRSRRRVQEEPIRVDVLAREKIDEKLIRAAIYALRARQISPTKWARVERGAWRTAFRNGARAEPCDDGRDDFPQWSGRIPRTIARTDQAGRC